MVLFVNSRKYGSRILQYFTVTTARPRCLNTRRTNSRFWASVIADGRPPALLSPPRHAGNCFFRAITLSTALELTSVPSFLATWAAICKTGTPAQCSPHICPRANASIRAVVGAPRLRLGVALKGSVERRERWCKRRLPQKAYMASEFGHHDGP